MAKRIRVLFLCTGVGIYNRGIETFFREAYDGLRGKMQDIDLMLLKGAGPDTIDEKRIWCIPRTGMLSTLIGKCIRRTSYTVEQLSFYPGAVRFIRKWRPDVIFYSDYNIAMQLYKRRQWIGVPFRLVYSNGAPMHPPFQFTDHIQQVAPHYLQEALSGNEPTSRHTLVPYGFNVPTGAPDRRPELKQQLRTKLGLPLDQKIILSVGAINAYHKRMHYTIDEISKLPTPRPYLVMLGAFDSETPDIIQQAKTKLGEDHFTARSVSPSDVAAYYQAADIFVLSSTLEGFGRVYIEALIHGLPVVYHDHPVMRYVVDSAGCPCDLTVSGNLAKELSKLLSEPDRNENASMRRENVRQRLSWEVLADAYGDMFHQCVALLPNTLDHAGMR